MKNITQVSKESNLSNIAPNPDVTYGNASPRFFSNIQYLKMKQNITAHSQDSFMPLEITARFLLQKNKELLAWTLFTNYCPYIKIMIIFKILRCCSIQIDLQIIKYIIFNSSRIFQKYPVYYFIKEIFKFKDLDTIVY